MRVFGETGVVSAVRTPPRLDESVAMEYTVVNPHKQPARFGGSMPESLTAFVSDLLLKAGMTDLPDDFKEKYVAKLVSQIEERVGLRALQELDEEQLGDFERLVQGKKGQAAIFDFFNRHVRDFPQKMSAVLDEFSGEFLKHTQSVRKDLKATTS